MNVKSDQAAGLRGTSMSGATRVKNRSNGSRPFHCIAVTSGKGGVGKTQVSANLAVSLAKSGKKVLLLDADLGLASLDLALGITPENNLMDVMSGRREIDEVLSEGPCGVHLIPACPGRYEMANMTLAQRERLWELVEEVAEDFDVLIVDTGAGIGSNAVSFASYADDILIVTTPDPTSLRDAYAMVKILHLRAGVSEVHVVANQVVSERDGTSIHARMNSIVQRFLPLKLGYLGAIPADQNVRESVVVGNPFVLRAPSSMAARGMINLTRKITAMANERRARPC